MEHNKSQLGFKKVKTPSTEKAQNLDERIINLLNRCESSLQKNPSKNSGEVELFE